VKTEDFDPFDVFGVTEVEWGKLKMNGSTCPKSEYLEASEEIISLSKSVLSEEDLSLAENIAKMLTETKKKKKLAIYKLMEFVSPPPKRPLYYCQFHIQFLPRWTRDVIRYLGDYVDVLVKEMTFEFTRDKNCLKKPLGKNLTRIKALISRELYDKLLRYNNFLYVVGKHGFEVQQERKHRFTSREVVLAIFVTRKLASEIKNISKMAREYSERG